MFTGGLLPPHTHTHPHHQTLNDSKVVIDDLGQGSQAVCCAGSVAMETKLHNQLTEDIKKNKHSKVF